MLIIGLIVGAGVMALMIFGIQAKIEIDLHKQKIERRKKCREK
jgi:hypothetical protein